MSSIQNVITTTFRARGNQAIAQMGSISQGFGTIGRKINDTSRMSERLNNQWRALGTTFRYALAGAAVFGTIQLGRNLQDLQRQVGLLQALGNSANGVFPNTNFPVTKLLQDARKEAVLAVTPINEFNEGLINMFSSVQNVPENQAARMMREISLAAQIIQTDAESASKAVFGMMNTFQMPVNLSNVQQITRALTELAVEVPGGPEAGKQIFQQFPQLAAVINMGRGTLPQVIGLYETLLRAGGTPATAGRGLQYLIQTVGAPELQTKQSQSALASVGITPAYVEKYGVTRAVLRLITAIKTRGGLGSNSLQGVPDDELEAMANSLGGDTAAMSKMGLSGAGARLAGAAIPRIHGVRALSLLSTMSDQMLRDLESINAAWNGHAQAVDDYNKRLKNLVDPQKMKQASIAIQGIEQQVLLAFQPLINLASGGIIKAGQFTENHTTATQRTALGAGALMAALGVGKFVGFKNLLGMGGRGFVMAKAAEDAMSQGAMGLGASPQNPLYVIVVGELFGGGTKGPGGVDLPTILPTGKGRLGKLGRLAAKGSIGRVAGIYGMAAVLEHELGIDTALGRKIGIPEDWHGKGGFRPFFEDLGILGKKKETHPFINRPGMSVSQAMTFYKRDVVNEDRGITPRIDRARKLWGTMFGGQIQNVATPRLGKFHGRAEVFMTIDLKEKDGTTTRKKVHVPVTMWEGGRVPSTAGKPGNKRTTP